MMEYGLLFIVKNGGCIIPGGLNHQVLDEGIWGGSKNGF
jgi:hypothetical protein